MPTRLETRSLATVTEIRAADEGEDHFIELRAVTYVDEPDDYGTIWAPGVFLASVEERLPALTWAHSWSEPLGRGVEFEDGDEHLDINFRLDDFDDVPMARRAWSQARSGTVDQASVGFYRQEWESLNPQDNNGAYERMTRARLDEVAMTIQGAVTGTDVLNVRSREGQVQFLEEMMRSAPPDVVEQACRTFLQELERQLRRPEEEEQRVAQVSQSIQDARARIGARRALRPRS